MCLEWWAWLAFSRQTVVFFTSSSLQLSLQCPQQLCGSQRSIAARFLSHFQGEKKLLSWHLKLICTPGLDQFTVVGALHWHRPPIMLSCWLQCKDDALGCIFFLNISHFQQRQLDLVLLECWFASPQLYFYNYCHSYRHLFTPKSLTDRYPVSYQSLFPQTKSSTSHETLHIVCLWVIMIVCKILCFDLLYPKKKTQSNMSFPSCFLIVVIGYQPQIYTYLLFEICLVSLVSLFLCFLNAITLGHASLGGGVVYARAGTISTCQGCVLLCCATRVLVSICCCADRDMPKAEGCEGKLESS